MIIQIFPQLAFNVNEQGLAIKSDMKKNEIIESNVYGIWSVYSVRVQNTDNNYRWKGLYVIKVDTEYWIENDVPNLMFGE